MTIVLPPLIVIAGYFGFMVLGGAVGMVIGWLTVVITVDRWDWGPPIFFLWVICGIVFGFLVANSLTWQVAP